MVTLRDERDPRSYRAGGLLPDYERLTSKYDAYQVAKKKEDDHRNFLRALGLTGAAGMGTALIPGGQPTGLLGLILMALSGTARKGLNGMSERGYSKDLMREPRIGNEPVQARQGRY